MDQGYLEGLVNLLDRSLDPNTDKQTRTQVDGNLSNLLISDQPFKYLETLTQVAINPIYQIKIRLQALVLLRTVPLAVISKLSPPSSTWRADLNLDQQRQILHQLFIALLSPGNPQDLPTELIHHLGDTISELGKNSPEITLDSFGEWATVLKPTLLANLLPQQQQQASNPILQTVLLKIYIALPWLFSNSSTELESIVLSSLSSDHFPLRLAALQAICVPTLDLNTSFTDTLYQAIVLPLVGHPKESEVETALTHLIEFVTFNHIPNLIVWLEPLLQLTLNQAQSISIRSTALECIITLIECRSAESNLPSLPWLEPVFRGLLNLMAEISEDEHWSLKLDDNDEDQEAMYIQAEQALDRLTQEVARTHCDQLFELILASVQQISHLNWQSKHALLSAIAVTGEGLADSFLHATEHIYDILKAGFDDPHPRVVYAAIYAISQLSSPLKITFSSKPVHQQVLSWLLGCLENNSQPRLQAFSAKALINVLWDDGFRKDEIEDEMIGPFLVRLISLCQSNYSDRRTLSNKIRLDALNAIGRLFGCISREGALAFYDTTTSTLQNLLQEIDLARKASTSDGSELSDEEIDETELKVFEATSRLAMTIGEQRFDVDAAWWVQRMLAALESRPKGQARILNSLAGLAAGMKRDRFVNEGFLGIILDRLLKVCQSKPDISISALLDDNHEFDDRQWESVLIGDQTFGIKSAELAEKELSVQTLILLANEMGVWLIPRCDEIVQAIIPLLKFYFSDEVRESAMTLLPLLIKSAKASGMSPEQLAGISTSFCNSLNLAFQAESLDSPNLADSLLTAWEECAGCQEPQNEEVVNMVDACLQRIEKLISEAGDDEDQDDEPYQEGLRRFFTASSRSLRIAIRYQPQSTWVRLLPHLVSWVKIQDSKSSGVKLGLKRLGFRLVGAFVKYHPVDEVTNELIEQVGQDILNGFNDDDECIMGLAPFIVGLCTEKNAESPKPIYARLINSSIESLINGLNRKKSILGRSIEAIQVARENCVSALAKIIRNPEGLVIDADVALPKWIEALPIEIDVEEVEPSYGLLLELIARGHESVDPTNNEPKRVEQVVKSLLSAICNQSISIECRNSLLVGLRAYLAELPPQIVELKNQHLAQFHHQPFDSVWVQLDQFLAAGQNLHLAQ